jgi:predicted aminopeptidase
MTPSPEALARADQILAKMAFLWTDDVEELRAGIATAIDEARMAADHERTRRWADAERLLEWLDTPDAERKEAMFVFSEGNERQIAYRFETAILELASEIATLKEALKRTPEF